MAFRLHERNQDLARTLGQKQTRWLMSVQPQVLCYFPGPQLYFGDHPSTHSTSVHTRGFMKLLRATASTLGLYLDVLWRRSCFSGGC